MPTHPSSLPEVLAAHTRLPVRHAEDGMPVEPGHVYVIPPNAILTIETTDIAEAQKTIEPALDKVTKRWKLDEVVTNTGKPSELYYIVRTRKSVDRDALLTAIRTSGNGAIANADIEIGDALAVEQGEEKREKKKQEQSP